MPGQPNIDLIEAGDGIAGDAHTVETVGVAAQVGDRYLRRQRRVQMMQDYAIVAAILALLAVLSFVAPNFLSWQNLRNVLDDNSYLAITACGVTVAMIAGGYDLSVGSVFALANVLGTWAAIRYGAVIGVIVALMAGLVAGAINGLLITVLRIHSFLVTLATGIFMGGVAVAICGGNIIDVSQDPSFLWICGGELIPGVRNAILIMVLVAVATGLLLSRTNFGRYVYSVGGNREASRTAGVRVGLVVIGCFTLSGFTASIAGIIESARTTVGMAQPGGWDTLALSAIGAVVIGGTSLLGGEGAIWRSLCGVLMIALITNGLNLLAFGSQWHNIFTGAVIIAAVALRTYGSREA